MESLSSAEYNTLAHKVLGCTEELTPPEQIMFQLRLLGITIGTGFEACYTRIQYLESRLDKLESHNNGEV